MLCLTRKKDEWINIGNGIRIVVIETKHDRVRLGIEAPKDVPIFRAEIDPRARNGERNV